MLLGAERHALNVVGHGVVVEPASSLQLAPATSRRLLHGVRLVHRHHHRLPDGHAVGPKHLLLRLRRPVRLLLRRGQVKHMAARPRAARPRRGSVRLRRPVVLLLCLLLPLVLRRLLPLLLLLLLLLAFVVHGRVLRALGALRQVDAQRARLRAHPPSTSARLGTASCAAVARSAGQAAPQSAGGGARGALEYASFGAVRQQAGFCGRPRKARAFWTTVGWRSSWAVSGRCAGWNVMSDASTCAHTHQQQRQRRRGAARCCATKQPLTHPAAATAPAA